MCGSFSVSIRTTAGIDIRIEQVFHLIEHFVGTQCLKSQLLIFPHHFPSVRCDVNRCKNSPFFTYSWILWFIQLTRSMRCVHCSQLIKQIIIKRPFASSISNSMSMESGKSIAAVNRMQECLGVNYVNWFTCFTSKLHYITNLCVLWTESELFDVFDALCCVRLVINGIRNDMQTMPEQTTID